MSEKAEKKSVRVTIDREDCMPGTALIFSSDDSRFDGYAGHQFNWDSKGRNTSKYYYVETYEENEGGAIYVKGSSWHDCVRKLGKKLGYDEVIITVEK